MATVTVGELTRVSSHSVRIEHGRVVGTEYGWSITREELFFSFNTEWRGQPAIIRLEANWYQHSSGRSEWRIIGRDARTYDPDGDEYSYGGHLTETARHRLSEVHRPAVAAWLETADFRVSHLAAVLRALQNLAQGLSRAHVVAGSRDLRGATAAMYAAHEISHIDNGRILKAANAIDRAQAAIKSIAP